MLDCSIAVVLPNCFPTLNVSYHSQEPGKANVEQIQRLHGTSIIHDAITILLKMSPRQLYSDEDDSRTIPWNMDDDIYKRVCLDVSSTSCVLFHRFFHTPGGSIYEFDVWSLSMASVLLATKIHDLSMISVRAIIHSFCSVYRQRILKVDRFATNGNEHELSWASPPDGWLRLSIEERQRRLDETISLPTHGPIYLEWYNAIVSSECCLLHHLGFVVYWIPDHHPHIFLESFCDAVGIVMDRDLTAKEACVDPGERKRLLLRDAYQLCRKALYLDLCVRFPPELICAATMKCAASSLHFELQSNRESNRQGDKGRFWWRDLWQMSQNELDDIEKCINIIISAISHVEESSNFRIASRGFIPSKLPNKGSFNDPGSFVWEMLIERLADDS